MNTGGSSDGILEVNVDFGLTATGKQGITDIVTRQVMSDDLAVPVDADPMAGNMRSSVCPHCGETFQRTEDRDVHLERHKPAPYFTKKERSGKVRCPKGCKRWFPEGHVDGDAHFALCDGSPPISDKPKRSAYSWWCEAHKFGTNGPRAWGDHKREHHKGKEPVPGVKGVKSNGDGILQILRLLKSEIGRIDKEAVKLELDRTRVNAAIRVLEGDLKNVESEAPETDQKHGDGA